MSGYLGTSFPSLANNNFGILSSSPHVQEKYITVQEQFYMEMETKGRTPSKMTGRYKHIAGIVRQQLQEILTNPDSFERLKNEGGGFNKALISRMYLNLPKIDSRDFEDVLEDGWLINAEHLVDDAGNIIDWVRKNVDGPVSVI